MWVARSVARRRRVCPSGIVVGVGGHPGRRGQGRQPATRLVGRQLADPAYVALVGADPAQVLRLEERGVARLRVLARLGALGADRVQDGGVLVQDALGALADNGFTSRAQLPAQRSAP